MTVYHEEVPAAHRKKKPDRHSGDLEENHT